MNELRQPSTPLGVVIETLNDTIMINGDRTEADSHTFIYIIFRCSVDSAIFS